MCNGPWRPDQGFWAILPLVHQLTQGAKRLRMWLDGPFPEVERRLRADLTRPQLRLRTILEKAFNLCSGCYKLRFVRGSFTWGQGLMYEPTTVGLQPHHPHREILRLEART